MVQISNIIPMLIPFGAFIMVVFIVWFATREKQARTQARAELNKQLLDKFTSGQELTEFLERKAGQRFLDGMGSEKQQGPREKVLGIIIPGCILTAIGIGFFWLGTERSGLEIPGAVISAAGVGLLIAAAVTYVLSKKWGLINGEDRLPGRSEEKSGT